MNLSKITDAINKVKSKTIFLKQSSPDSKSEKHYLLYGSSIKPQDLSELETEVDIEEYIPYVYEISKNRF